MNEKISRNVNPFRKLQSIRQKMKHWRDVIADPTKFYPDAQTHQWIASRYRSEANRNLRKLVTKYPDVYEKLDTPEAV